MRSNKHSVLLFALLGILALALAPACSGGDDDTTFDAAGDGDGDGDGDASTATADAPPAAGVSDEFIGQPCSAQTDCGGLLGTGYQCLVLAMGDMVGVCASVCVAQTDCSENYAGTGTPACALQVGDETFCAVGCTTGTDCPVGSSCSTLPGSTTMICTGDN